MLTLDYDGEQVGFTVEGETGWGAPSVLLDHDDNLIAGRPWEADGFVVAPFLMPADCARLAAGVAAILARRMTNAGLSVPEPFALERYHEVVTSDATHAAVSAQGPWSSGLNELPVPAAAIRSPSYVAST